MHRGVGVLRLAEVQRATSYCSSMMALTISDMKLETTLWHPPYCATNLAPSVKGRQGLIVRPMESCWGRPKQIACKCGSGIVPHAGLGGNRDNVHDCRLHVIAPDVTERVIVLCALCQQYDIGVSDRTPNRPNVFHPVSSHLISPQSCLFPSHPIPSRLTSSHLILPRLISSLSIPSSQAH